MIAARLVLVLLAAALGACAMRAPVPALPAGPPVELAQTPFFPQDEYQCGPAALATVLRADGVDVSPTQLVSQVYVPDRRGSLQAEMTATVRRYERIPSLLPARLDAVTHEVRSGKPVLVLLNLGLDAAPVWHYAVVVGFDPAQDALLLRSGREARQILKRGRFDAAWKRAGRWAVTVGDADSIPVSATPEAWIAAVAPFESQREFRVAERGYRAAISRWPQAAVAHTALGNVHSVRNDWLGAVEAYSEALALQPAPIPLNNRAYALSMLGCANAAQADVRQALTLDSSQALQEALARTHAQITARASQPDQCPAHVLQALMTPEVQ